MPSRRRQLAALAGCLIVLAAGSATATCTPLDQTHAAWTALLARRVEGGRVDYDAIQRREQETLAEYLERLSAVCPSDYERWTPAERIAFWINVYNAFTIRQVLDHYPVRSIRSIGWLPGAAFRHRFIPMPALKGGLVSLDDVEHRTLRSDFREPRIHFALVCAARSCPPLRSEAYRGQDLERQLDDQGRTFLRDPTKNRYDTASETLHLSAIFRWFRKDFESEAGSLASFVAPYMGVPAVSAPGLRIEFLDYDWRLNDQRRGNP